MKRSFFIFLLLVSLFFISCRMKRDVQTHEHKSYTGVEKLEFRRLDSLWNSLLETTTLHIEFYPPEGSNNITTTTDTAQADADDKPGISQGAVKSVDITFTQETTTVATTKVDSVATASESSEEEASLGKQTSAGHDYGFLVYCAIVAALLFVVYFKIWRK